MAEKTFRFFILFIFGSCILPSCAEIKSPAPLSREQTDQVEINNHTDLDELTFLALGDMGTGGANQQAVADAMLAYCSQTVTSCDFILTLGDNVYGSGIRSSADTKLQTHFENPYADFGRTDFWMTPGNHDWLQANSVQSEIDYTLKSERWRMPNNHYAIPDLPEWLHIYSVDTTILQAYAHAKNDETLSSATKEMLADAHKALCGQPGWRILFGHHPIYSSGKHGMAESTEGILISIEQALGDLIEECDIQLFLAGHDHHQEMIQTDELIQIIQGAGGRYLRQLWPSNYLKGKRWATARFGFATFTISADQLSISYFGVDSYGGGWEEICSWHLQSDGNMTPQRDACILK